VATVQRTHQPRGERRRRELLEAALEVIAERGVAATTHRAVAQRAGVPPSSTTYYFESLDQLLEEALLLFVREEAARLRALSERLEGVSLPPLEIARLFLAELRSSGGLDIAQFELYLEASRRPRLRAAARGCVELYTEVAEAALRAAGFPRPAERAHAFVALIDGFGLHRMAGARDDDLEQAMLALFEAG
jgi:TetR/AcrR family transcriptional regulator, regulator of biofilm formation and stress response